VGLPLTSAPSGIDPVLGFVGHCLEATNIGLCAPLYMALREGGGVHNHERLAPPIRVQD
jgi:hypothetical protein